MLLIDLQVLDVASPILNSKERFPLLVPVTIIYLQKQRVVFM